MHKRLQRGTETTLWTFVQIFEYLTGARMKMKKTETLFQNERKII